MPLLAATSSVDCLRLESYFLWDAPVGVQVGRSRKGVHLGLDLDSCGKQAYFLRRDFPPAAAAAGASEFAVPAGFFLPSICARLCLRAAIKSTTGANFFGFSTAATSPPSSVWLRSAFLNFPGNYRDISSVPLHRPTLQ